MERENCQEIPMSQLCIPKQQKKYRKIAGNIRSGGEALPQNTGYSYNLGN